MDNCKSWTTVFTRCRPLKVEANDHEYTHGPPARIITLALETDDQCYEVKFHDMKDAEAIIDLGKRIIKAGEALLAERQEREKTAAIVSEAAARHAEREKAATLAELDKQFAEMPVEKPAEEEPQVFQQGSAPITKEQLDGLVLGLAASLKEEPADVPF